MATLEAIEAFQRRLAQSLLVLHQRWAPHPAQAVIGAALLSQGKLDVFAQCGRNFGKTELVAYLLWRYALTFPGSENYYFAPYMKQAREIMWASQRIQQFGPKTWIEGDPNNTEMRIRFKNGSFIKLDGSDNVDAYRGVKPRGLSIYDEFKDFRPEFHDAYDPNRAAFNSPLLIIGTPPEFEGQFNRVAEAWASDPKKAFFHFPTGANPHISKQWLDEKKAELYRLGEGDKWEREYLARFVRGGARRVFPMLDEKMVKPHQRVIQEIARDRSRLEWFSWSDPAGASCFAVLYVAINPYSRTVYVLDEIYEQRQSEMTVNKIGERIIKTTRELYENEGEGDWRLGYDEAETWFANEMLEHFKLHFEPTQKAGNAKDQGITLIKDIMLSGKIVISDRCRKLWWELDNYQTDDKGKFVKKNDHLVDCLRYILAASYYTLNESEHTNPEKDEMWRGARIEDDFPSLKGADEWESEQDLASW